jgi:hypothetical protein
VRVLSEYKHNVIVPERHNLIYFTYFGYLIYILIRFSEVLMASGRNSQILSDAKSSVGESSIQNVLLSEYSIECLDEAER